MKNLKNIRVFVSLFFFISFIWTFLEITKPNEYFTHTVSALQFVPSFLEFTATVFMGGGAGFILILIITAIFGRVYCSFLCPLGTLQDCFIGSKRAMTRTKNSYMKPFPWLQYLVLAAVIVSFMMGSAVLLGANDPFAIFGRIISDLIKPGFVRVTNWISWVLGAFDIYAMRPRQTHVISMSIFIYSAFFFFLVGGMSLWKGRLYCNTVCPVGGLLSLVSKLSVNKLVFDTDKCTSCGLCEKACKANCIDYKEKKIDFDRCVDCYDCIEACKFGAVKYENTWKKALAPSKGRRKAIAAFSAGAAIAALHVTGVEKIAAKTALPIVPPGAKSIQRFKSKCIGCHLCVTTCPSKVLTPSPLSVPGMAAQPFMDYTASFCAYNCNLCTRVCPTGALMSLTIADKRLTQLGVAKFTENNCIVKTKGKQCTICNEYCPTKACSMVAYKNGLEIPKVIDNLCIGCGACERVCPAVPKKAIIVKSNEVHKKAEKPAVKKEKSRDFKAFPF